MIQAIKISDFCQSKFISLGGIFFIGFGLLSFLNVKI